MTRYELWVYRADNRLVAEFNGTKICEVNDKFENPGLGFDFTDLVQPGSKFPLILTGYNAPSSSGGEDNPYHFQYEVVVKYDNGRQARIAGNENKGSAEGIYGDYKVEKVYTHTIIAETKTNEKGQEVELITCESVSSKTEAASDGYYKETKFSIDKLQ